MRKILILFVVALIGFASCADSKQSMTVTVTNSLALERAGEMVEVPMSDVVAKLKLADTAQIVVVAAAVLVVMVLGGSWQVVANAEKHGGFFWWMDKNEEGTTMITAPEGVDNESYNYKIEKYYDIEKIPEEYKEYVEEVGEIERVSAYEIDNIKVMKSMYNDTVYVYMNNVNDALRFEIRIYPQEIQRVRETYPGYTFEKEFEDGGINFDIFSKEESSGEYTYIMYFYYGKEKYIVIGRSDEDRIQDIVIEYKNVILSHEGKLQ